MNIKKVLEEKGIRLPESSPPLASYVNGKMSGNLLFISGKLPLESGKVRFTGKVGKDISAEEGYAAARLAALHVLSSAQEVMGDLGRISGVLKVTGFVNAAPGFTDTPKVINGASDLFVEVFGEAGRHSRSAVGVAELPLNSAVEIEVIFEVR